MHHRWVVKLAGGCESDNGWQWGHRGSQGDEIVSVLAMEWVDLGCAALPLRRVHRVLLPECVRLSLSSPHLSSRRTRLEFVPRSVHGGWLLLGAG